MSRSTALTYYQQIFSVPTTTYDAEYASNVFLWMSLSLLCLPVLLMTFKVLKKDYGSGTELYALFAIVSRIVWIITLSIIFHRIQISWQTSQDNIKMLKGQTTFS